MIPPEKNGNFIFVNGFASPLMVDLVKQISDRTGLIPAYWLNRIARKEQAVRYFRSVLFEDSDQALNTPFADQIAVHTVFLDQPTIKRFAKYESNAIMMMARFKKFMNLRSQGEWIQIYYEQLAYYLAMSNHFKPVCFLSRQIPHSVPGYMMYVVCAEMGVPTIFLDGTVLDNRLQISDALGGESSNVVDRYKAARGATEPVRLRGSSEAYLGMLKQDYQQYTKGHAPLRTDFQLAETVPSLKSILTIPSKNNPLNYKFRIKNRGMKFARSFLQNVHYTFFIKRLRRYYESRASDDIDYDVPYVFVPLHYQPEMTTSPNGDVYVNQWLLVRLLSQCLPEDWRLYVKEHPYTFKSLNRSIVNFRSRATYEKLLQIPNVQLIPTTAPQFKLIDHACAVASVGGTSGWEAVNRGVPAIIFGHSYYRGCEGVLYAPDYPRCRAAITTVANGYRPDPNRVAAFLKAVEEHSIPGLMEDAMHEQKLAALGLANDSAVMEKHLMDSADAVAAYLASMLELNPATRSSQLSP